MIKVLNVLFVLIVFFSNIAYSKEKIVVGSKNFTESLILAEIFAMKIKELGNYEVEMKLNLGGSGIVYEALKGGEIDLYPEYSGTIAFSILKKPKTKSVKEIREALLLRGMTISDSLGFNNTYAFALREKTARSLGLKNISDLKHYADLRVHVSYEFLKRADGYYEMEKAYGFLFPKAIGIEHSLAYSAIENKKTDLIDAYSTDGKLKALNLVTLVDDKDFFPKYFGVVLAKNSLKTEHPSVWAALRSLEGKIDEATMIELNAMVDVEGYTPQQAAKHYLGKKVGEKKSGQINFKRLIQLTFEHLALVFVSLFFAIVIGIPVGVFAVLKRKASQPILAVIGLVQTIPSLALLCFFIPVFGIGIESAWVALFLYALLPIVRNTFTGLTTIDKRLLESAEALGLSTFQRLKLIEIPLASQQILSGVKTSAVMNVGTATLAALIGAGGYGTLIVTGLALNDMNTIMQGAIPSALLALVIHFSFEALDFVFVPKGLRKLSKI